MPLWDKDMNESEKSLAITAEALFLFNLLLAPGLGFIALLMVYALKKSQANNLAANHLSQTVGVSLIGGVLIVCVIALIFLLGGFDSGYTWMVVVLYFTFIHSSLILMGVIGLVKALNGEHFRYPLIGKPFRA
ncbi:MAG: DUF4870 domain-containing protein [gamma proteobacterium symbiont of Bathyaustriella thionipta]|nr:DUF4870 domain-containing protein [gamma proteobacterium symbiont of Bathyaustriella thionipta]